MSSTMHQFLTRHAMAIAVAAGITMLGGVYVGTGVPAKAAEATAMAAPAVEFINIQPQQIRDWHSYSGRLAPVEVAEIKPLVSGTITQVLFEAGQEVKVGDPLFVIDPRPYQHVLQQAEANLASAESRLQLARDEYQRAEKLHAKNLASDSVLDSARSNQQVAEAGVMQARSAQAQAKLNLDYAHVKAPIAGRLSRAELTVGNVVEAGSNAPVLTSIVDNEQLYAEFNVDEQSYVRFARSQQHQQSMPVTLSLSEADGVQYLGHIQAFDNHLDSKSGTIRARAIIDNADGVLAPGLYVNVRVGTAQTQEALLIPDRAVGTNQGRKFVYVVDAQNLAQYREVVLGASYQDHRIVASGLAAGDQVVVNGIAHIGPNSPVNPTLLDSANLMTSGESTAVHIASQ